MKLLILGILYGASAATTTVYQCEKNDVVIYSQFPCGEDAKVLNLYTLKASTPDSGQRPQGEVGDFIKLRQLGVELSSVRDKITRYRRELEDELAMLRQRMGSLGNDEAAEAQKRDLTQQMTATNMRYKAMIEREQLNITRIEVEQKRLKNEAGDSSRAEQTDVADYIKTRELERRLTLHLNKIAAYQRAMDGELAKLKAESKSQSAEGDIHRVIGIQMQNVTAKYSTLIDNEQKEVDRLLKEKAALQRNGENAVN